jgi:hypothetical protein
MKSNCFAVEILVVMAKLPSFFSIAKFGFIPNISEQLFCLDAKKVTKKSKVVLRPYVPCI